MTNLQVHFQLDMIVDDKLAEIGKTREEYFAEVEANRIDTDEGLERFFS